MLGEALRLIRVFHDCKATELAIAIGISPSHISEIEKGHKTPSMKVIRMYAEYFDTTPSAILFFSEGLNTDESEVSNRNVRRNLMRFLQAVESATT